MKTFSAIEQASPELSALASQSHDMLKSHVKGYTTKTGTFVAEHDDKRTAAQPKAPGIGAQHEALRASSKPGHMDHETNQIAADHMKAGDQNSLKQHLQGSDTAARDHVLDHIHPDHWEGLGYNPLNKEKSVREYDAKFSGKPAAPKAEGKPAADAGPADGEVGHEEHKAYGKYFKKGDKVKDNYGKTHDVLSHRGPEVNTSGGSYHPTKLHRVDGDKPAAGEAAKQPKTPEPAKPAVEAPKEHSVHHSELSEGDALYDKAGQKVDEVESLGRAMRASDRTVHTRAGYSHATQNGHLMGLSNKKPGESAGKGKPMTKALLFTTSAKSGELQALVKSMG